MSFDQDGSADDRRTIDRPAEDVITERVSRIAAARSVIDQAKGMLMMLHGIDADQAFALLRWRSQDTNVKLRDLAEQLVAEFRSVSAEYLPPRDFYDKAFMTLQDRVEAPDADERS